MLTAYAASSVENVTEQTSSELAKLIEAIIGKIPLWIAAFIIVIFTILFAKIARRMVENKLAEKGIDDEHKEVQILGGRMTYAGVLTVGMTVGLKIAGIDLTTILAAVAFGIGFALRDLIMNFLAGIMILVGRQFTIGDFISVGGTLGRVREIQSRVTILQAIDGTKVIVPNGDLFKKQVVSFTGNPFRRVDVYVAVDYRGDVENAMKLCLYVTKHTKGILAEPEPVVLIDEWGASEIEIRIRFWVESKSGYLKIKSNLLKNLKNAYDKYNISMPWPITQLVYDKDLEIKEKTFKSKLKIKEDSSEGTKDNPVPISVSPSVPLTQVQVPVVVTNEEQPLKPLGEV